MYEELKARLLAWTKTSSSFGLDSIGKDIAAALEAIEQLELQLADRDAEIAKLIEAVADHVTVRAEQYAELQKYRDAPVVWIHSGHLHQAMNQPFLCRVLPEQCEGYKHLIVKPGE